MEKMTAEEMIVCNKANVCPAALMGDCATQVDLNDKLTNIYKNDKRAKTVLEAEVVNCKNKHGV